MWFSIFPTECNVSGLIAPFNTLEMASSIKYFKPFLLHLSNHITGGLLRDVRTEDGDGLHIGSQAWEVRFRSALTMLKRLHWGFLLPSCWCWDPLFCAVMWRLTANEHFWCRIAWRKWFVSQSFSGHSVSSHSWCELCLVLHNIVFTWCRYWWCCCISQLVIICRYFFDFVVIIAYQLR